MNVKNVENNLVLISFISFETATFHLKYWGLFSFLLSFVYTKLNEAPLDRKLSLQSYDRTSTKIDYFLQLLANYFTCFYATLKQKMQIFKLILEKKKDKKMYQKHFYV